MSEAASENVILRQEAGPLPDRVNSQTFLLHTSSLSLAVQE